MSNDTRDPITEAEAGEYESSCPTFDEVVSGNLADENRALRTELERLRGMEAAGKALVQRHGPQQHDDACECEWCVLGRTLGGDARQAPRCIIDETTFCQPESCGNTSCREQRHTGGEG